MHISTLGVIVTFSSVLAFTISNIIFRKTDKVVSPTHINTIRTVMGTVTFILAIIFLRQFYIILTFTPNIWLWLFLSIIFAQALGDTFYFQAQKLLGTTKALAVSMTFPIFTTIFTIIFMAGESPSLCFYFSIPIVIGGLTLLTQFNRKENKGNELIENQTIIENDEGLILPNKKEIKNTEIEQISSDSSIKKNKPISFTLISILVGLGAAIFWSIGIVMTKYTLNILIDFLGQDKNVSLLANAARFPFALVALLIIGIKDKSPVPLKKWAKKTWLWLFIGGLIGTSLGAFLYIEATRIAGAPFVSLISTTSPLFAAPLAWLINKEKITLENLLGILIIIGGVILSLF